MVRVSRLPRGDKLLTKEGYAVKGLEGKRVAIKFVSRVAFIEGKVLKVDKDVDWVRLEKGKWSNSLVSFE